MTSSVDQNLKISGCWKNGTVYGQSIRMNITINKNIPVLQNTTKALELLFMNKGFPNYRNGIETADH